jgi:hypothetical protein
VARRTRSTCLRRYTSALPGYHLTGFWSCILTSKILICKETGAVIEIRGTLVCRHDRLALTKQGDDGKLQIWIKSRDDSWAEEHVTSRRNDSRHVRKSRPASRWEQLTSLSCQSWRREKQSRQPTDSHTVTTIFQLVAWSCPC